MPWGQVIEALAGASVVHGKPYTYYPGASLSRSPALSVIAAIPSYSTTRPTERQQYAPGLKGGPQVLSEATTRSVRCVTVSDIIAESKIDKINLLKIDVEGCHSRVT